MTTDERELLHEQAQDDCRMVEKWIACIQCDGGTTITREVAAWNPRRLIEIEAECPNCHGEGSTWIEVCNACGLCEDECKCLELSNELEAQAVSEEVSG